MSVHKNYLVIGGTSGIGESIVKELLARNAAVWVGARTGSAEPGVHAITFDVLKDKLDVSALPGTLDGLVYCPGSINLKPFARLTSQDFRDDFQINLVGAVNVIQAVLPNLKAASQSSIVLFSTVAVTQGMPYHASIGAAKGAIEGLTRSLAAEFAPKIRVNAIAPSLTRTRLAEKLLSTEEKTKSASERHPLKRIGEPADLSSAAVFLLSSESSWISGQVIGVDGGLSSLRSA
jgi:NAD(P)-dependent dehydrogenase (short-subunit alcohol dehydrogenase family)